MISLHRATLPLSLLAFCLPCAAQERDALFDAPVVVLPATEHIEDLLDFDGDGDLDAVSVWWTAGNTPRYAGFRNDGAGVLQPAWSLSLTLTPAVWTNLPTTVATGDFDRDGRDDFASAINDTVRWFVSDPAGGAPAVAWTVVEPADVVAYAAADFDGDGRTDLAVLTDELRIHLTAASGAPMLASTAAVPATAPTSLVIAEVDGDGTPDVAILDETASGTTVLTYSVRAGIARPAASYPLGVLPKSTLAAGDIDGDGDRDLVVFEPAAYHVLRHGPAGTFALEAARAGGPATELVDVDGDGDLDGACCGGGGFSGYRPSLLPAHFEISINDGTGRFAPAYRIPNAWAAHLGGVADMDGDGDLDLVGGRSIHYGHGTLDRAPATEIGAGSANPVAIADADGDGDPDLGPGLGTSLRNDGGGAFVAQALSVTPPAGHTLVGPGYPGDWDGDGDPDLLVEEHDAAGFALMRLLRNNGGGGFELGPIATDPPVSLAFVGACCGGTYAPLDPSATLVADVEGDGDLDLIVHSTWGAKLWRNDGSGRFEEAWSYGSQARVQHVGDWDGDGRRDLLAVIGSGSASLWVFYGTEDGTFRQRQIVPGGVLGANNIDGADLNAFGDFDGDGDLDVGSAQSPFPTLYLNDGSGGIERTVRLGTEVQYVGSQPLRAVLLYADVDGDGLRDFMSGPVKDTSNAVAVYRRTGPGLTFAPAVIQVLYPGALADVDGDGDLDALTLDGRCVPGRRFSAPGDGYRLQYGDGLAGAGGMVPTLGESGPFRIGGVSTTHLTGGLGGSAAVLVAGTRSLSVPLLGGTLLAEPVAAIPLTLRGTPGAPGEGHVDLSAFLRPTLAGASVYKQAGVLDPAAPQGVALSNGLLVTVGAGTQ